jgi:hypothetical protein
MIDKKIIDELYTTNETEVNKLYGNIELYRF